MSAPRPPLSSFVAAGVALDQAAREHDRRAATARRLGEDDEDTTYHEKLAAQCREVIAWIDAGCP